MIKEGHARGPPLVFDVPPSVRPDSMESLSSFFGRLASIIASHEERPHVHVPHASRKGPSMLEQLDDIYYPRVHT